MSKHKAPTSPIVEEDQFFVRRKPDPIPFHKFLFNSREGTVLGRTGASWGKCTIKPTDLTCKVLPSA